MKVEVKFNDGTVQTFKRRSYADFNHRYIEVALEKGKELFIPFESVKWFIMDFKTPKEEK